jgi:uncharacterized protein YndB with AHSA1/START domain
MANTNFTVDRENLEVRIERIFKTTPERLYRAHVTDDDILQWWGPAKYTIEIDKNDVRVGGAWRFIHVGEGQRHVFSGVYQKLDEPHTITRTFEYEPWPGHVMVETFNLEPQPDGTTKMTVVSKYKNLEDLEGMVGSGMESGATEGMDRLAKLVENS